MRGPSLLRSVVSDLTGHSQQRLITALVRQVGVAGEAVALALEAATGGVDTREARRRMGELEHAGDRHREQLVTRLSRTLVTPIDREDLFRLSRSLDDVVDNLRDFTRELDLFGAQVRDPLMIAPLEALATAIDQMQAAVTLLASDTLEAVNGSLRTKKLVNDVRASYQSSLAQLFERDLEPGVLQRRELLRRLDVVGLRVGDAADALADGGLKRGT